MVGWLEFNVPFQHKYGYNRDDHVSMESKIDISYNSFATSPEQP